MKTYLRIILLILFNMDQFQKPIPITPDAISEIKKSTTLYSVSPKCDGSLVIVTFKDNIVYGMNTNNILVFKYSTTIVSTETLYGEFEKESKICYLFDLLDPRSTYKNRYTKLTKLIKPLDDNFALKKTVFPKSNATLFKNCKKLLNTEFPNDGLIFTPYNAIVGNELSKYPVYKWKPLEKLTADLLIKEHNHTLCAFGAMSKKQFYALRVKPTEYNNFKPTEFYFPLKYFHPSNLEAYFFRCPEIDIDKYKNKIVECLFRDGCWVPLLVREDKTLEMENSMKKGEFKGPNNWKTISDIYDETLNPISIDQLIKF